MNYVDAEIINFLIGRLGGKPIENLLAADLIIIITCGVRAGAEERAVNWIGKARNQNQTAVFVLTGCLSHRKDIKARLDGIANLFMPIEEWVAREKEIFDFLTHSSRVETQNFASLHGGYDKFYQILPKRFSTFRAYIPIMTGCNNFCSYCVVPYARGREISRPPEDILREAKKIIKNGFKELYLLGQNVNSYRGIDGKRREWNFAKLLGSIDKIPGKFWIRFISSHPKDISEEFISIFRKCRKVSPNLHLPLQSGSNKVLKAMNRRYTRENYLDIISRVRKNCPRTVFSTDIIVGFPGETDKDFQDSVDIVKEVGFEMLYCLKYSPRPGTASFKLKDDISAQTKIFRQRTLDQVWKKIARKKNKRFIGNKVIILIDKVKKMENDSGKNNYVQGKTFDNKDVQAQYCCSIGQKEIKSDIKNDIIGKWATVLVKETGALALKGELVKVAK